MIQGWRGREAKAIYESRALKGLTDEVAKKAKRRLDMLAAATSLEDLRVPPSNRLHKLQNCWSISVNMQYRLTFTWGENGPDDVWFGDYR